jgi:hypothetical protein
MRPKFYGPAIRCGCLIGLALACILMSLLSAQAQASRPVLGGFQELRTAPAPGWLRPGMRLNYYSAIAIVPGIDEYWEADPNGNWVDPKTGKHYKKVTPGRPGDDELGRTGAGHGYTQVNVVAMDQQRVVLEVRAYGYPKYKGPLALISASSEVTIPGFGQDWWANPAVLQRARNGFYGGLAVLRMNHITGGQSIPVLRIQFEGSTTSDQFTGMGGRSRIGKLKARDVRAYELNSGALYFASTSGASVKGITYTECTLKSSRRVPVPWAGQPAPSWLNQTRVLNYQGTLNVPYGARPVSAPISASFTVMQRGRDWAQFLFKSALAGPIPSMPQTSQARLVTGSAQFGGLWVPPNALQALRSGQVLDRDPVTGVTVSVGKVEANTVVISETNSIQRIDYAYQRSSGLMLQYSKVDLHQFNITTTLRFVGSQ